MRTVGQMRRDGDFSAPINKDSLYQKIERTEKRFNTMPVPKKLQAALPFASKPKVFTKLK
jgi:ribosome biogenesis protein BMS1